MGQPHDGNSISPADPEAGTSSAPSRAPVGSKSLPESSHSESAMAASLVSRANTTPIGDVHHHSHGVHHHPSMFQQLVQPFQARPEDFDLDGKDASLEALEKWRRSSLVLNSARRFRYAADLKSRTKLRSPSFAQMGVAIAAVQKFKMGLNRAVDVGTKAAKAVGFGLGASQLSQIVEHQDLNALRANGGLAGVAKALCVDVVKGIQGDDADLEKRVQIYGRNTYPEKPAKPFWEFVWDAMQDFTLMILAVCSAVSLLVGIATEGFEEGWYDGAGIFLSILLVVLVTAISDYRQSLQFIELDKEKKKVFIPVIRNGQRVKVSVFDIVVGDVVMLSIGDVIPTDGLLIQGSSLVVDESSMTGESLPVRKNTTDHPFLLAGTKVQDGSGTFLTTGVGMQTEWGHLMAKLSDDGEEETPLQVKLSGVATLVGRIGLLVALLVFGVLMTRLLLSLDLLHKGWTMDDTLKVVDNFAVAVTIVVVAVPEGLPLAVTLSLAFAMKKMMADKALVRKLAACETMGSATTICSDKTGTLTANQMTVVRAWLYNSVRAVSLDDNVDLGASAQLQQLLRDAIFTNTSGDVQVDAATNKPVFLGSPTEMALLSLGVRLGGAAAGGADIFQEVRRSTPAVKVDPFNSGRKRMGVAVQLPNGHVRVIWKGAAEIVIGMCNKVLTPSGEVVALNAADIDPILTGFTSDALRTLAFAYTELPPNSPLLPPGFPSAPWDDDTPLPDSDFTLIAIAGIQDPLRPTAKIAVATCQSAGIMVRMVTGDNLSTAVAISRECGILTEGGEAIEGPKFRNLSPQEMRKLIPRLQVMARSSPTDKHTLVNELRAMGEVVAVTGDGTNDAPALKEADIGLAMGIAGTEVAKESADVVILDDNFQSIVNVAKWGRSVYTNIQKFVQFQLTVNLVALATNFVAACVTGSAPLTAVQLLWVNLIMDTLGALALATEPPTDELMKRPPVGRRTPFISNIMWRNIIGQSAFQLVVLFVLQFAGIGLLGLDGNDATLKLNTIIFNTFVFCQVFNEVNSREMEKLDVLSGVFTNSVFVSILAFTVIFQIIMVQFLCKFASTVPLSLHEFMLCVGLGAIALPVAVVVKFIPVPATPFSVLLHRRFVGAAPGTPRGPDSTPLLAGRH